MQVNGPILKAAPTQKNQRPLSSVMECTKVSQRNAVLIQMTAKKKKNTWIVLFLENYCIL